MTRTISLDDEPHNLSWNDIFTIQRCIQKAKRVVVVVGAGISVASGIPDFRSADGIFASLKKNNPKHLVNGIDLFNASVFSNANTATMFYHLTAELKRLADKAKPTPVHCFLRQLDLDEKLQRVYTQNIDNLESQAGLIIADFVTLDPSKTPANGRKVKSEYESKSVDPSASSSKVVLSPTKSSMKTVYLHGSLSNLWCPKCHNRIPFTEEYRLIFAEGRAPECENCTGLELARQATEKRSMGTGMLRPGVVLYGEFHPDGEQIGNYTSKDLKSRPDCLIVIGTSLKVPGIKRLVKEMAKAVHLSRGDKDVGTNRNHTGLTMCLNLDKPKGNEWDGIFDYFVQGDCQESTQLLQGEGSWKIPAQILKDLTKRIPESNQSDGESARKKVMTNKNQPIDKKQNVRKIQDVRTGMKVTKKKSGPSVLSKKQKSRVETQRVVTTEKI